MPVLVVASGDTLELDEVRRLVGPVGWEVRGPAGEAAAWPALNQGGASHREQAINRARAFGALESLPVVAIATALQVYALDQNPGLRTHDYAGPGVTDEEHIAKLLKAMSRAPAGQRIALFQATAAMVVPGEEKPRATSATLECEVTFEPRGEGGFLFDRVIQVQDRRTLAEMPDADRDRLGHRGMALKQLARHLNELAGGAG